MYKYKYRQVQGNTIEKFWASAGMGDITEYLISSYLILSHPNLGLSLSITAPEHPHLGYSIWGQALSSPIPQVSLGKSTYLHQF
jgi:hypothetical protein